MQGDQSQAQSMSQASAHKKLLLNSKRIMKQLKKNQNSSALTKAHSIRSNQTNLVKVTKMRALKTLCIQI